MDFVAEEGPVPASTSFYRTEKMVKGGDPRPNSFVVNGSPHKNFATNSNKNSDIAQQIR